ncbi:MarR family transcriptional regulator [Amycolatopsis sp., V23-08]|uniref:MarR family transcriptional regulator n=1 Tax=Amycolatopsis heterodermiae TaxID=3110235 RepID=A0ABU5RC37_9PSEU|nr:MarR family transcriptional regulator [Amycolatopsis sp., V23-08]MEA5363344.1 MarR family transcriptional regulator [Amycolatopsis sp., V23-08]
MGEQSALDHDEAPFWRSLMRITTALPRALEDQFLPETGLAMTDYGVLVALSEAPDRLLRISALAAATGLSLSRISRVVDDLARRGLVEKRKCADDGRASNAVLTDAGLARLEAAYPTHLARARAAVFDHLSAEDIRTAGPVLARLAAALDADPLSEDCEGAR